jgi:hypothetical protein
MTWPGLTPDVEHGLFMFHLSNMSNDKQGVFKQEIWAAPTQNSRIRPLGHGMCGSGGSI